MGRRPSIHAAVILIVIQRVGRKEYGPGDLRVVCRGDRARPATEAPTRFSSAVAASLDSRGRLLNLLRRPTLWAIWLPMFMLHSRIQFRGKHFLRCPLQVRPSPTGSPLVVAVAQGRAVRANPQIMQTAPFILGNGINVLPLELGGLLAATTI